MNVFRNVLQVGVFLFFAAWFLCLVTGRPFRIPAILPSAAPERHQVEVRIKPSPIEMLKRVAE